jgi:hypothetical protein
VIKHYLLLRWHRLRRYYYVSLGGVDLAPQEAMEQYRGKSFPVDTAADLWRVRAIVEKVIADKAKESLQ